MAESDITTVINLIAAVAGLSGVVGLFWGIHQYRESRITKRKDTLFQLVREFDRSEQMYLAKKILDGYVYNFPESINLGVNYFSRENLKRILRHHQDVDITDPNEIKVRESFSDLFDFFDRLGYLYSNEILKKSRTMSSGKLFEECGKASKQGIVDRSYRNYMRRMKQLGLVRESGSRRWKKYEIVA